MSQNTYILHPKASSDIKTLAAQFEERTPGKALQFFSAVRSTIELLTEMPYIGAPADMGEAKLHSLRYVRIEGFKKYLLFYRPLASKDGIVVHRVLNQARDIIPLLEEVDDADEFEAE